MMLVATLLIGLAAAAFGGLWRRALGGWLDFRRPYLVFSCVISTFLMSISLTGNWQAAFGFSVLATLQWVWGHEWTDFRRMLLRYSIIPAIMTAGLWFVIGPKAIAIALTGPAIAGIYLYVQQPAFARWANRFLGRPIRLFDDRTEFIDGNIAFAEVAAGAVFFGVAIGVLV